MGKFGSTGKGEIKSALLCKSQQNYLLAFLLTKNYSAIGYRILVDARGKMI